MDVKNIINIIDRGEILLNEKIKRNRVSKLYNDLSIAGFDYLGERVDILKLNYTGIEIPAHELGTTAALFYKYIVLVPTEEAVYISNIWDSNSNTIEIVKRLEYTDDICIEIAECLGNICL